MSCFGLRNLIELSFNLTQSMNGLIQSIQAMPECRGNRFPEYQTVGGFNPGSTCFSESEDSATV